MRRRKQQSGHRHRPQRCEPAEAQHLRLYSAVGSGLKELAARARRSLPQYLRLILEQHLERLDEEDRKAGRGSPGAEDGTAHAGALPKKVPFRWRTNEETDVYHFRLAPAVRVALKQRGAQVGRNFSSYVRPVLEEHVKTARATESPSPRTYQAINDDLLTDELQSIQIKAGPRVPCEKTAVWHFRFPAALASALKKGAVDSRRTFTDYVCRTLEDHVQRVGRMDRKNESASGGEEHETSQGCDAAGSDEGRPMFLVGAGVSRLRASVEAAVRHADLAAWHVFSGFEESLKGLVSAHGPATVRTAIEGLDLPGYVQPVDVCTNWDGFMNRLLEKAGNSAAESPLMDSTPTAAPKPHC